MKECSHCGALMLLEDLEAAKCSRCGTLLPFENDRPSVAQRNIADVLDQLPASVRSMVQNLSSRPPESGSERPSVLDPISGYPDGGVVIRTVEAGPVPRTPVPSTTPPRRPSSRPPSGARHSSDPAASVDLLVHLPPPGFEGPEEDPHAAFDLPDGFSPEQLGVESGQHDMAAAQAEALRRSLHAPPLRQRQRQVNFAQLLIAFLLLLLLATLVFMWRLYLNGDI